MLLKNKLAVICVIFTVLTLTSTIWNSALGVDEASNFHLLLRFMIVALAIGSLYIFKFFAHLPFYVAHIIHYVATMLAVFLLVWVSGFFVQLHPDAYRDIFWNYTVIYLIISLCEFVYFRFKNRSKGRSV